MREAKDRSSKWMPEHRGDSIVRLAGIRGFTSWRPAPTELVHPLESPDGVLELFYPGEAKPTPALIEIATYPERRASEQVEKDAIVLLLKRNVLPEVITLVLHPKGQLRLSGQHERKSRSGLTSLGLRWQNLELWTLLAADLLAANDVGLTPWIPLTRFDGPPEPILHECRARIDRAPAGEQENLLAVAQVMTQLRYNDQSLLSIFGGRRVMIESPLIQEIVGEAVAEAVAENTQKTLRQAITRVLARRFGSATAVVTALNAVVVEERLNDLLGLAASCPDLAAFQAQLAANGGPSGSHADSVGGGS
jgi:hypothetical protein